MTKIPAINDIIILDYSGWAFSSLGRRPADIHESKSVTGTSTVANQEAESMGQNQGHVIPSTSHHMDPAGGSTAFKTTKNWWLSVTNWQFIVEWDMRGGAGRKKMDSGSVALKRAWTPLFPCPSLLSICSEVINSYHHGAMWTSGPEQGSLRTVGRNFRNQEPKSIFSILLFPWLFSYSNQV